MLYCDVLCSLARTVAEIALAQHIYTMSLGVDTTQLEGTQLELDDILQVNFDYDHCDKSGSKDDVARVSVPVTTS